MRSNLELAMDYLAKGGPPGTQYGISKPLLSRLEPGLRHCQLSRADATRFIESEYWRPLDLDKVEWAKIATHILFFAIEQGVEATKKRLSASLEGRGTGSLIVRINDGYLPIPVFWGDLPIPQLV